MASSVFAGTGVFGAFIGSTIGKAVNGSQLLLAFAVVMIVVAASMLRGRGSDGDPSVRINRPARRD